MSFLIITGICCWDLRAMSRRSKWRWISVATIWEPRGPTSWNLVFTESGAYRASTSAKTVSRNYLFNFIGRRMWLTVFSFFFILDMDVELASVVTAVSKNKSIKHLHMGRNLTNMKAKHISCVMESVVQLVQEEDCVLQSLMLPDSRLKSDLYNLINALGSNQCLQTIDIR